MTSPALFMSGLIHVTGAHDSGKTSFSLECGVPPERIMFLDSDVKGFSTVQQFRDSGIEFGGYHNMIAETKGLKEIQTFDKYMQIIGAVKPGQFDALVIDVFSEWESTFKPVISKDPKKYRDVWSPMGTIKGAEEWGASYDLEAEVLSDLLQKFRLVILVTHLKNYYVGSKRVENKFVPACKEPVVSKSMFRIWLRRNPNSPVPIGLVLKRLNKKSVVGGRIATVNVLPSKLVPGPDDTSLWDVIQRYWDNPIGTRKPAQNEMPDEYELSCIENTLTQDQRLALQITLEDAKEEAAMASMQAQVAQSNQAFELLPGTQTVAPKTELSADVIAKIKEMGGAGKSASEILAVLKEGGFTWNLPDVMRMMKG